MTGLRNTHFHWNKNLSKGGISIYGVITKYFNCRGYGFI